MKRQHEENSSFVNVMVGLSWCCIVVLAAPIAGGCWLYRHLWGLGLSAAHIKTSLFTFEVIIECEKNFIEDQICKVAKQINGNYWLHDALQLMCPGGLPWVAPGACDAVRHIQISSYFIFVTFSLAVLFQILGQGCLYYYWHVAHLRRIRQHALAFFFAAPLCSGVGIILYSILSPNLAAFPNMWTQTMHGITGSHIFSIRPSQALQFGWCWYLAVFASFFSMCMMLAWGCFFQPHEDEVAAEIAEEMMQEHAYEHALQQTMVTMQNAGLGGSSGGKGMSAGGKGPGYGAMGPTGPTLSLIHI